MESKLKFIQNKTITLSFASSNTATADIYIPFAIDRIVFRSLAYEAVVTQYAILKRDLIRWESIGIVYRDS